MNDYEIERFADCLFFCCCPDCCEARDKRLMEDMGIYYGAPPKPLPMHAPLEFEESDGLGCIRGTLNALGFVGAAWAIVVALYLL